MQQSALKLSIRKTASIMPFEDWGALTTVLAAWLCTVLMSLHLGLYSDDYWNLFEVNHRSGFGYLSYHLSRINNRYTYALMNKLMHLLFFHPDRLFDSLYIRASRIVVLTCHFAGVWLAYKSLARIGIPKAGLLVLMPFLSFALFADQALFWNAAAFAYPVGFFFFAGAVFALINKRTVLFSVLAFFSLGSTEFVILPLFAAGTIYAVARLRQRDSLRMRAMVIDASLLLAPFIAWALIVYLTPAAAHREARVHGHPKLTVEPLAWAASFFSFYLRQLQPTTWLREHWYFAPGVLLVATALLKKTKERLLVLLPAGLYSASIFPLSAVGYNFYPISHARLWYFPGIFFYITAAAALGFIIQRAPTPQSMRSAKQTTLLAALLSVIAFGFLCSQTHTITQKGEEAYGCIRGFLEEIRQDADGRTPSRVELCGMPPALHNFSVFLSPNCGRFALALMFHKDRSIPFVYKRQCPKKWGRPWRHSACPAKSRYKITYR